MGKRVYDPSVPFQSIRNAARITGLSTYYIRNGCKDGTIPHIMCGNEYRIDMGRWYELLNTAAAENCNGGDCIEKAAT